MRTRVDSNFKKLSVRKKIN